jgi:hypothetical protein
MQRVNHRQSFLLSIQHSEFRIHLNRENVNDNYFSDFSVEK